MGKPNINESGMVESIYHVGPRKVWLNGKSAAVTLGKDLVPLIGRKVLITIKVLREPLTQPVNKIS